MTACLFLGVAVGVALTSYLHSSTFSKMSIEIDQKNQRLVLFERLLYQLSKSEADHNNLVIAQKKSIESQASITSDGYSQTTPMPTTPQPAEQISPAIKGIPLPTQEVFANSTEIEDSNHNSNPYRSDTAKKPLALQKATPLRPKKQTAVGSGRDLNHEAPLNDNELETISAFQMGIKFLFENGVLMHNGKVIRIGDFFPSGERLLKVDLDGNRVVTSERQIHLKFNENR